jgi:nitrogen fixation/metabolism regulation signal transduction histidine kinase
MQKRYILLLIATILLVSALIYDLRFSRKTDIHEYTSLITEHLNQQEKEVTSFFENKDYINRQLSQKSRLDVSIREADFNLLDDLSNKDYTITIHQGDSLVFWTNNAILPEAKDIQGLTLDPSYQFKKLKNGHYVQIGELYRAADIGAYTINAFIPIKHQFELESNYLSNKFTASDEIPASLVICEKSDFPIKNQFGETLFYLKAEKPVTDYNTLLISLTLYLSAFFFLIVFFYRVGSLYIKKGYILAGASFFITTVFGLRLITYLFEFGKKFEEFSLFNQNFDTNLSASLGDLLINIVLFFWVMGFFHSEIPLGPYNHFSRSKKLFVTVSSYLAIFGFILTLTAVFKTLVFNTSLDFDFNNVFDLGLSSLLAVTGIILLLITLFLFSHRMMMTIKSIGLNRNQRLFALGIAMLILFPFLINIDFIISPQYLLVLSIIFVLVFDLFIDNNTPNFTWLLIWLVILSAFPSILLFRYNAYKDNIIRQAYAKELTDPEDPIVEESLELLQEKVTQNASLSIDDLTDSVEINAASIQKQLDRFFTNDTYLFYNYAYTIYGFDQENRAVLRGQDMTWEAMALKLENSSPTKTQNENLKYWSNDRGKSSYLMQFDLPIENPQGDAINVVMEINRQRREPSKVYTELLKDKPYKNLEKLSKYDYAVYKNNRRVDYEGNIYGSSLKLTSLPEVGTFHEETIGNRSELIYTAPNNVVVVIGKESEAHLKKAISLFSYIFSNLLLFVLFFTLANYFVKILPNSVNFFLSRRPSLRNRIQFSVIGMIVVSFLAIGFVTVWFFNTGSNEYHGKRLGRKTESVEKGAIHELSLILNYLDTTFIPSKENLLKLDLVNSLSQVHRLDVNMYDLSGALIASSEEDIFNKGIISEQMAAPAFRALTDLGHSSYTQENEVMGNLNYKSAYIPLKLKNRNIAFLGLPYYTETNLRSDVTVFMGTLINVYVFLLLIAGGLTIVVANSITRPIATIGDKLKQIKLGSQNQRLEWNSQDEIGVLVGEYNKMIRKLEESADALAQSEREGAWREMAKQVAHEIKNPLTPMKLSIQYLQHAFRSKPDNIEPLLKRVSNTLIEQIDNLAHIASEFSNFAKMPRAENQNINFNQLVLSVYDLFHDGDESGIDISLKLPKEVYTVYADKSHMIRVLTNLLKNAQQAIPEDRKGKIEVSLFRSSDVVTLKVKDNGMGIPNDKKDKVFVPNFTTKSSGTGLGLAISKNIIESVEGEIYFNTIVGEGTEFFVELPIVEVNEPENVPESIIIND